MITEASARKLCSRFRSLTGGKSLTADDLTEYARVAQASARSDAHLAAAITAWIDSHQYPPAPAELRAIIEATPHASRPRHSGCPSCDGTGRRSYWALITTETWPDTGRIRRRIVEEIPCSTGDPNHWLLSEPELAARVDGHRQKVALLCGYCDCPAGPALRTMQRAALSSQTS